jgi:uncharacterized protein YggE
MKNRQKTGIFFSVFFVSAALLASSAFLSACFGFDDPKIIAKSDPSDYSRYKEPAEADMQRRADYAKSMSVLAEGRANAVSDESVLGIRVRNIGDSAEEALEENMLAVAEAAASLANLQISDLRVQTIASDIQALYDEEDAAYAYEAVTILEARTAQMQKTGIILSSFLHLDNAEVFSASYAVSEAAQKQAKEKALPHAMDDALTKALSISRHTPFSVGPIQHIKEISTELAAVRQGARAADSAQELLSGDDLFGLLSVPTYEMKTILEVVFWLQE